MPQREPTFVVATLWEYILPIDRGNRYEDPLDDALAAAKLGGICGGGSQLSDDCGIEFVDIEMELQDLKRGLAIAKATLEANGAPKGSVFRFTENGSDRTMEFGVSEYLAIFLDGVGLPQDVYENTDINTLADQINEIITPDQLGEIRSSWCGPTETALFLFGGNAEQLYAKLKPVLATYPLCQNARIVIRHGKADLKPRTVRMAMQE